jgi:hypothetical protein
MASLNHHVSAKSRTKLHLHGYNYSTQTTFPIPPQLLTLKMPGNFGLGGMSADVDHIANTQLTQRFLHAGRLCLPMEMIN